MKLVFKSIVILFLLKLALSCEKTESSSVATEQKAADENDLAQAPILMKNNQGDEVTVVYFAKGEKVAIKITINGEERVFEARGTSDTGGLVFSDGNNTWEMLDKISGKLTDADGKVVMFRGEE